MTANRAWGSYLMASTIEHRLGLSHIHFKPFLERQPTPDPHIGHTWVRAMPGPKSHGQARGPHSEGRATTGEGMWSARIKRGHPGPGSILSVLKQGLAKHRPPCPPDWSPIFIKFYWNKATHHCFQAPMAEWSRTSGLVLNIMTSWKGAQCVFLRLEQALKSRHYGSSIGYGFCP